MKLRTHRRRNRGVSLIEMLVGMFLMAFLGLTMLIGIRAMINGASQQLVDSGMGYDARQGVDEMMTQMRYGSNVVSSYTSGSKNYTTGTSSIVMRAIGYDTAQPTLLLAGISDYLIFTYDATKKEVSETLIPGVGSKRVARTGYRIAQNVSSLSLVYRARNQFKSSVVGPATYTLSANATGTPTVLVNGVAGSGTWTSASPKAVTVSSTAAGSDIQILYPVSPTDSSALALVKQVDVTVNFANKDSRNINRTLTMSGSACLRNQRD